MVRTFDEAVGPRGDATLAKERPAEWPFPVMGAVNRVIEPRRPGVQVGHPQRHGEVRVREINPAGRSRQAFSSSSVGAMPCRILPVGTSAPPAAGSSTVRVSPPSRLRLGKLRATLAVNVMPVRPDVFVVAAAGAD